MSALFEELAGRVTPMGELSLRRRRDPALGVDLYEVKLGDEFLMSSLFTVAEVELARLGLAAAPAGELHVVVGGLGLGYTARAVLDDPRVVRLTVIEALEDVIAWHEQGLLPEVAGLADDPRVSLVHGDFFAMVRTRDDLDPDGDAGPPDAVLVDIDHSPRHHLDASHGGFYTPEGLACLARHLQSAGVFALWSDDPPDAAFQRDLRSAFAVAQAHVVRFPNPLTGGESANTVYVAGQRRAQ